MTFDRLFNWDRDTALAVAPQFIRLHPNWITTGSLILAAVGLATLSIDHSFIGGVLGAALIFASRWVDWIDGYVARATNRCSTLGGLYDIAVGYLTMVTVMIVIGLREGDVLLACTGAVAAILLRLVLMGSGWALACRQRLAVVPWNPQKLLLTRQRPFMRRAKWALDLCRNDYWIVAFSLIGGGLRTWGWAYTAAVIVLTAWVILATGRFVRRVPPAAPKFSPPPCKDGTDRC